jgi:predicted kinase
MTTSGSIVILTGPPGAGKTTLAPMLAQSSDDRAVHLHSDDAYVAIRKGWVPQWLPGSEAQNETVMRALAAGAVEWARGGYEVILDGVFTAWTLPTFQAAAEAAGVAVSYVVLQPGDAVAIARASARQVAPLPDYAPYAHLLTAFAAAPARHQVDCGDRAPEVVAAEVRRGLEAADFRL